MPNRKRSRERLTPLSASVLDVPRGTLLRWCQTARVDAVKVGGTWMLTDAGLAEAEELIKARNLTVTWRSKGGFKRYVSMAEFSRRTGISYSSAWDMAKTGKLRSFRVGGFGCKALVLQIPKEELARVLAERKV